MGILQEQKSASATDGVNGDFAGAKIRPAAVILDKRAPHHFLITKLGITASKGYYLN